jgi:triosephosphate isomerase
MEIPMRKKIVAGNWKMNKTVEEAIALVEGLKIELAGVTGVEAVVCPPFTALKSVSDLIADTEIKLGCQNMSDQDGGAYTGEVAPAMLKELFVKYVILGHSERREYYGETDAIVNSKVKKALEQNLRPIVCVGEKLEDREAGKTETVVEEQVRGSLADITAAQFENVVVAYEPVWAIGTGKTATIDQVEEVHEYVRSLMTKLFGNELASNTRILYGGSVKPDNIKELMELDNVDGALVGGASLDPDTFIKIVNYNG